MVKMSKSDRAKQFMPFAALRGYYGVIRDKEKIQSEKRELTEEELFDLNEKMISIKKGDLVCVTFYKENGYITISGAINYLDKTLGKMRIVKTDIDFKDISKIQLK